MGGIRDRSQRSESGKKSESIPSRAQQLADLAIAVAETIGNQLALAKSLRAKANALYALDQHAAAIEMHKQAAALFEAEGDEAELARTLSGSIQPLLLLGRYDQALAAGDRARELFAKQGNTLRLARLDINIGNIYHRQDRFADALVCYERAYDELVAHDDAEGMAAVMSNLPLCYMNLNQFPRALEMYRRARQHCEQKGMPILVAYADYNIAYLYFLRGEYGRAIQMLREASQSGKKANDAYQVALCSLDLSEIYIEVNLIPEASQLARQANEHFQRLGFGYEAAKALVFAAVAASRQGQAFEGIKLFSTAKELFIRDQNHVWPALIDLYEALVLFNEGRLFEARRQCIAARDFFSASPMRSKAVLAELLLARIALRMNDAAAARTNCQEALQQLGKMESPMLTYQAEFLMGEVERSNGKADLAYQAYRRARTALETLRGNLRGEELKIAFFQNKLEVYENLVDLCLSATGGLEEAFEYIEMAKSRSLMDRLLQPVHVPAESDAGQSDLVRSIRNLREELNWYYNLIEREQLQPEERSPERIQKLEQQARSHEDDLVRALREATLDEASEAGVQMPSAVSLDRIRSLLPADTAVVEYFRIQDRDVACVLTQDALQIRQVTVESRIKKLLQLLQFQLSKFRLDPQYVKAFEDAMLQSAQGHLASLHQELVAPIGDLLQAKHLVFAPHGLLHHIPFHALYDGESYLIDRFSISYAPSASVYALCREKTANALRRFTDSGDLRCASTLDSGRSRSPAHDSAQPGAVCRRSGVRGGTPQPWPVQPDRAHCHPRIFSPGQSDVLIHPARRILPEPVRPVSFQAPRRIGGFERVCHRPQCGNSRRRTHGNGSRSAASRGAVSYAQPVGRSRRQYPRFHDCLLLPTWRRAWRSR